MRRKSSSGRPAAAPGHNIRRLLVLAVAWASLAAAFGWQRPPIGPGVVPSAPRSARHRPHRPLQPQQQGQPLLQPGARAWGLSLHATAAAEAEDDAGQPQQQQEQGAGGDGGLSSGVVEFAVEADSGGWPMDIVLARRFPQLSRRACRRLLQEGHVRVDGKVMRRFAKVGKGAAVRVTVPQASSSGGSSSSSSSSGDSGDAVAVGGSKGAVGLLGLEVRPEPMNLTILHEDEWLTAVSKGPRVVVQPCESAATGTLLHGVVHHWMEGGKEVPILASPTQAIVHRLDKDTSGVLLLAKTLPSARRLSALFKTRAVRKTYLAICHGDPCGASAAAAAASSSSSKEAGVVLVDQPIFRKANGKMAVPATEEERAKARRAVSRVETIATDGSISLVRVRILTGRTHQIRVHLAHLGCPVLGDDLYGGAAFTGKNRRFRRLGMKRILLHAYVLALKHPFSGQDLELLAPVPTDMLATARYVLQREKAGPKTAPSDSGGGEDKEQGRLRLLRALRDGKPLTPALLTSAGLRPLSQAAGGAAGGSGAGSEDDEEEDGEEDDEDGEFDD